MDKRPDPTQAGSPDSNATAASHYRKAYQAPMLTMYGSVTTLTQAGSGASTEATNAQSTRKTRKPSDCRLKHNINQIGLHPLGFSLYLFDYKPAYQADYGAGRQFGVMAQEVETIVPTAVSVNAAGFKVVDYAQLGIQPSLH